MYNGYEGLKVDREICIDRLMTFFCKEYEVGYHFKGESHDFWEFVLILGGSAGVYAGEEIFHLTSGQCVLHKPNEFHSIWAEGDEKLELGIFSFSGSVPIVLSDKVYYAGTSICSEFLSLYREAKEIFTYVDNAQSQSIVLSSLKVGMELRAQSFISGMESLLARAMCRVLPNERRYSQSAENYLRLISVISQNLTRRMSIPEIAAECNMSVANAKRVFTKYAGCGISVYCNSVKIDEAKKLLASGHTVGETAELLGFEDQSYFSAFFKRLTGMPPSRFR